jgi:hypothetical protein
MALRFGSFVVSVAAVFLGFPATFAENMPILLMESGKQS